MTTSDSSIIMGSTSNPPIYLNQPQKAFIKNVFENKSNHKYVPFLND